jgi:hypothetical protein
MLLLEKVAMVAYRYTAKNSFHLEDQMAVAVGAVEM